MGRDAYARVSHTKHTTEEEEEEMRHWEKINARTADCHDGGRRGRAAEEWHVTHSELDTRKTESERITRKRGAGNDGESG